MKTKKKLNPFARSVIFLSLLMVIVITSGIVLYYYVFSIPEPEGLSLASWPNTFTDNFSAWITYEDGSIRVKESGIERLDKYRLWLQIIDDTGTEVYAHNKPESYPTSYTISELVTLSISKYENGNTIFVSSFESCGKTWNYVVGFPYAIGKYMLYYNGENVTRLSPIARIIILTVFGIFIISVLGYGFWISRKLSKIMGGIKNISLRTYQPLRERGMFSEVFGELNKMDLEIRHSDKLKEDTEQARKEWIANITHDLKTPLSPIKGYAELLAESSGLSPQMAQEYGSVILKNVDHTEKLIDDLKLTYQLDSGMLPYNPMEIRLLRFLKELVIDLVNDPAFSNRDLEFESDLSELVVRLDPDLFRRAVQNLIINALVHNSSNTKVVIAVCLNQMSGVSIFVRDNGTGMSEAEQKGLWERYYRGTNTKEKPEGSGLGLAIAKQIVTLHGGDITVKSKIKEGTEFEILLPLPNMKSEN